MSVMKAKQPHGPLMTFGNMRELGVQRLIASCLNDACRHTALIEVSSYPAETEVPYFQKLSGLRQVRQPPLPADRIARDRAFDHLSGIWVLSPDQARAFRRNARAVQLSAAPTAKRLPGGTTAVIAYTQSVDGSIDSMIATQVTAASHPIERTIHVQTAACAAMRILDTPIQSCPIIPGING